MSAIELKSAGRSLGFYEVFIDGESYGSMPHAAGRYAQRSSVAGIKITYRDKADLLQQLEALHEKGEFSDIAFATRSVERADELVKKRTEALLKASAELERAKEYAVRQRQALRRAVVQGGDQ